MIAVIAVVVAILVGGIVVGSFFIVNASWQCGQIQQGNFNVVCTANPTGTSPYSYVWNFGDGSALSYLQNPSHQYSAAGTYTITIQITDGTGSVYKNSMSLCVSDANGNCPTVSSQGPSFSATISSSNMNPTVNSFVNFNANIQGGNAPYLYSWNIGGSSSSLPSPSFGFQNPGEYPVQLTLVDSKGNTINSNIIYVLVGSSSTTSGQSFVATMTSTTTSYNSFYLSSSSSQFQITTTNSAPPQSVVTYGSTSKTNSGGEIVSILAVAIGVVLIVGIPVAVIASRKH